MRRGARLAHLVALGAACGGLAQQESCFFADGPATDACAERHSPGGPAEGDVASLLGHRHHVHGQRRAALAPAPRSHAEGATAPNESSAEQQAPSTGEAPPKSRPRTAREALGVTLNSHGDYQAFICGLGTNCLTVAACLVGFMLLRYEYPLVYSNNVLKGTAPSTPPARFLGWAIASLGTSNEEAERSVGLDCAMLLEFSNLGMRIMWRLAVPLLGILAPLHYFCGGHVAHDKLSYFSVGNVEPGSWLHWLHPLFVWLVVLVVQSSVYEAQRAFLPRRFRWLSNMPEPRATTVLVEGIPEDRQSDGQLLDFFEHMFSKERVKSAYVVKRTGGLVADVAARDAAARGLKEANAAWEKLGRDPLKRPVMLTVLGHRLDSIKYYEKQLNDAEMLVRATRAKILAAASAGLGEVYASTGFVTFAHRSDAEVAMRLDYTSDAEEWVVSIPPGPDSVRWEDLKQDPGDAKVSTIVGYAMVAGLYLAYMPLVLGIADIAVRVHMGPLEPFWSSLAPTIGLQIMVSFLPTFLICIFKMCFVLKDEAWAQHKLHEYYFWFNVVFVVLVTAVGASVVEFTKTLLLNPIQLFRLFGETMPHATHFYMNFMVVQWVSHSMNMLRYVPLSKFLTFRKLYSEEEAQQMAEPEDQDFYGIGSRSARWTTDLLIGIVYGTICPPMLLLTFLNFAICRVEYGYLIPFAETRKPDLGGAFWVQKMHHIFIGLGIYVCLMTGVLLARAAPVPAVLAGSSLIYVAWSYLRFLTQFNWEKLPYAELRLGTTPEAQKVPLQYVQPELLES